MADEKNEDLTPQQKAAQTRAAKQAAEEPAEENPGAISAVDQAVGVEASQDSLNPAFAGPEARAQAKKDWAGEAEHTVDAAQIVKDQNKK